MANVFQTQTKMFKALAFQWKAFEGFADHCKNGNSQLPNAIERTGHTVYLRRPSKHVAAPQDMGGDYDLPTGINLPSNYGVMVDSVVPFSISKRFSAPLQVSVEDLLTKIDREDVMETHITPAIVNLRNQINTYVAKFVETAAGNTIKTDGTADGYMRGLYDASALMLQRAGISEMDEKTVLFNPKVMPVLGLRGPGVFHAEGQNKMFNDGTFRGVNLAGYNVFQSPLLAAPTVVGLGSSAVVSSSQDVTGFLTAPWTQTWTVALTGVTSGVTVAAGTKIKFTNSGTDINWCVANTDGTIDAGYSATFTVVTTKVATGTTISLTLSEPFIAGGDYQNVVTNLIPGTTTVSIATASGLVRPSYAFAKDAILIGSPKVIIPKSVDFGENLSLGGFNIALIEDHALSMQRVTQLVAFIAVAVPKPEAVCAIY